MADLGLSAFHEPILITALFIKTDDTGTDKGPVGSLPLENPEQFTSCV